MIDFGDKNETDYLRMHIKKSKWFEPNDEKRLKAREDYIKTQTKRQINRDWDSINMYSLERWLLWEHDDLHKAIKEFKLKFGTK